MDSEVVLPAYNNAVARYSDLRGEPSGDREPTMTRAEEVGGPAMEERAPSEADLRKIVEAGGGAFIGLQERVGGKSSVVQFNDPDAKTKSTISIDPEAEEVTPEKVRRLIEEKRRTVPAEEKTRGLPYMCFTRGI